MTIERTSGQAVARWESDSGVVATISVGRPRTAMPTPQPFMTDAKGRSFAGSAVAVQASIVDADEHILLDNVAYGMMRSERPQALYARLG